MKDLTDFRSFERSVLFWLGAQAESLARELETQWQQAREAHEVDLGAIDHDE